MAVSGGYEGALAWMNQHGYTRADLDSFVANNGIQQVGRVDSAFDPTLAATRLAQAGGYSPATADSYADKSSLYAQPTALAGNTGSLLAGASSSDSMMRGSYSSGSSGGAGAVNVYTPGGAGLPSWALPLGLAVLAFLFLKK